MGAHQSGLPDPATFGAVLFDLDGVLTPTADIHERAWGDMFRAFLVLRAIGLGSDCSCGSRWNA